MTSKGKHSGGGSGAFYRDLAMMILGILLVGAAVFFLLFLLADKPTASSTTVVAGATTTTTGSPPTTVASTSTSSSSPATTTSTVPVRSPDEVRVSVLNSIGVAGAAGRLVEELKDAGYQTLPAGDYSPEQQPSRIWYRPGFSAEANELLVFVPSAQVEPLPEPDLEPGADVIIIIGTGYEE
jgi:hypothetical protein